MEQCFTVGAYNTGENRLIFTDETHKQALAPRPRLHNKKQAAATLMKSFAAPQGAN
jgi:hypothetical protein